MAVWRVLTWNVRGAAGPDLAAITTVLDAHRPDVVALQEVQRGQARRLGAMLRWQHCWARKHYPYTPLVWWRAEGLALLTPHSLGGIWRESISPGISTWIHHHRILLAATVARDGDHLRTYDTHLAAHRAPDDRIAQARRVATRVAADDAPVRIVAGDLNAAGEPEVLAELRAVGLRDPGGGPTHSARAPRRRLDYIVVPDAARVREQWTPAGGGGWPGLSDHLPVVVEFEV